MKLKKILSITLTLSMLFNYSFTTFANTLSNDNRYEALEGDGLIIDDILEKGNLDINIEGNTVVNIAKKHNPINLYREVGQVYCQRKAYLKYPLKANTTYTIYFNITKNPYNYPPFTSIVLGQGTNGDTWSNRLFFDNNFNMTKNESYLGIQKATFTTSSKIEETSFDWINFIGEKDPEYNTTIEDVMIFEGDVQLDDYIDGIVSVGESLTSNSSIKIKSENKNLFKNEFYSRSNLAITEFLEDGDIRIYNTKSGLWRFQYFTFDAKPNTTYTFSVNDIVVNSGSPNINIYEAKGGELYGDIIYGTLKKPGEITFTTSDYIGTNNIKVVFSLYSTLDKNECGDILYKGIQIEEKKSKTDYTKHKYDTKNINLSEPLRGLLNGAKDRIIKKDGQWYIERNCIEVILNGLENNWVSATANNTANHNKYVLTMEDFVMKSYSNGMTKNIINDTLPNLNADDCVLKDILGISSRRGNLEGGIIVSIDKSIAPTLTDFKNWLNSNNLIVVYELKEPYYESLNINSELNIFKDTTYISANSILSPNLKVVVDRVANRAKESSELAKSNPTVENISLARMWINLMRESILKDEFHDTIDTITEVSDMVLEKKKASANLDLYIKCENLLSMSLNTNSISFEDFSGVEDMVKESAVNISINSSLPYSLNAYLPTEIQNSDKSNIMNLDILSIKENSELNYQKFSVINNELILKSNCESGNNKQHNIDLKLNAGVAHEKDVYKTTIKLEVEQK